MISFARQDLILRPIEKRLYLFADERSEGENKFGFVSPSGFRGEDV